MLKLDLLREIKKTKNRFISIVLLVVIAVAFLYGLKISAPDMQAFISAVESHTSLPSSLTRP